jgi:predicted lipoprotein
MPGKLPITAVLIVVGISLAACKFEPTKTSAEIAAQTTSFNPDKMVSDMWNAKVIPYLMAKAGDFKTVRELEAADIAAAGAKYGHKEKVGNSPWTLVVRLEGKIISSNTQSRAATIDVDGDGDGKADATVQIGPAMRGTALRDSLDFVSFNDFTNQIDFAQFGKAFNTYASKTFLSAFPRDALNGSPVKVLGTYQHGVSTGLPLISPAALEIQAAK